jgi:hypothetical protein
MPMYREEQARMQTPVSSFDESLRDQSHYDDPENQYQNYLSGELTSQPEESLNQRRYISQDAHIRDSLDNFKEDFHKHSQQLRSQRANEPELINQYQTVSNY